MDIETLAYIAVFVGVMIFNAVRASKKKQEKEAAKARPTTAAPKAEEPSVEDIIQEILGQRKQAEATPPAPAPRHQPQNPVTPPARQRETHVRNSRFEHKKANPIASPVDDPSVYDMVEITEMGHEGEHSVTSSAFEPDSKRASRPVYDRSTFNLRNAIIMETILNRPYK